MSSSCTLFPMRTIFIATFWFHFFRFEITRSGAAHVPRFSPSRFHERIWARIGGEWFTGRSLSLLLNWIREMRIEDGDSEANEKNLSENWNRLNYIWKNCCLWNISSASRNPQKTKTKQKRKRNANVHGAVSWWRSCKCWQLTINIKADTQTRVW